MRIAGLVILFHPAENTMSNILSYLDPVEKLFVIDNTESPLPEVKNYCDQFKKIIYLQDGENKGLSARLNQVSKMALAEGFDWLLTMDQDSSFEKEDCNKYFHCFSTFDKKEEVSIFGINFLEKKNESNPCDTQIVHDIITSGSLVNLNLIASIGFFDENLFIDEVDFEYCLRSMQHGYLLIQFTNIFLKHNLGELSEHHSLRTRQLSSRTLHSPQRLYYMTRNFLYVQSKYKDLFKNDISIKRKALLNRFKNNILYNTDRASIIKNIFKGFRDYKKNKMGKNS